MLTLSIDGMSSFVEVMTVLIIFVLVLVLTYFVTRWIANYQKGQFSTGNIEVIEMRRIAQNKYIQIVRVGDTYLALGIGKDEIQVLAELSKDEIRESSRSEMKPFPDFKKILERSKKKSEWKE